MDVEKILREKFGDISQWQNAPDWWLNGFDEVNDFISNLKGVETVEIGRSAGGRPILAACWGEKEPLETTCDSLHSAFAGGAEKLNEASLFPSAFYGKNRRKKQVMVFQGALHGTELEGTVAAINFLNLLSKGEDLRGRRWDKLREEAQEYRIVVIPFANPDGRARMPIKHFVGASQEFGQTVTMGLWKDGSLIKYPAHKYFFPLPKDEVLMPGSYFNDNYVNLQYDFCMPERQPETVALGKFYLDERPDVVIVSHSNAGSLVSPPEVYLPIPFQHQQSRIGAAVRSRLLHEGFQAGRLSPVQLPDMGTPNMSQCTSIYHVSGALAFVMEYPCGHPSIPMTQEQILDVGMLIFDELCHFGNRDGFRPLVVRDKKRV